MHCVIGGSHLQIRLRSETKITRDGDNSLVGREQRAELILWPMRTFLQLPITPSSLSVPQHAVFIAGDCNEINILHRKLNSSRDHQGDTSIPRAERKHLV